MRNLPAKLVDDDSGATAIEYGLIAACIAIAIIAVLQSLGTSVFRRAKLTP
jgi:pilus assembly protein Flp/PilA